MLDNANAIKKILEQYPQYQEDLFSRGYLVTSRVFDNLNDYPFYNKWKMMPCGILKDKRRINIYSHGLQDCYTFEKDGIIAAIVGHAYNPFDMKYDEVEILEDCITAYQKSSEDFFEKVSELTGTHLILLNDKDKLILVQDCSGMKSCYFGNVNGDLYITSHPQLVGDICDLPTDPFVKKLVKSRCYNIGNRHLPGNITPFKELKRLGGNTYAEYIQDFRIKRFYPCGPHDEIKTKEQFDAGIQEIVNIMHRNIELATKKWENPTISLSGGTDSKTTLACANGLYNKFSYFSFHCKPQEMVDANAAHKICGELGLEHTIYPIPDNNEDVEGFDELKRIIDHNTSYFKNTADHEIRKMIFLNRLNAHDVELKSWASETVRVFLERKYKVKMPKVLSERHFSIFQTRYFLTPFLLKKSDRLYKDFMKEIGLEGPLYNFEHSDLFYWEVRMGAWGTSVVSSLDFCHNVTMPFNNRKLIELFLSFPHEERKLDNVHKAVIALANKQIDDMNVEIKNLYFHSYRIWLEKVYYYYRTLFK